MEITESRRSKLLELAALRGEKGFSAVVRDVERSVRDPRSSWR
jgi:hypothetical protein